jgi:hypothetical protein
MTLQAMARPTIEITRSMGVRNESDGGPRGPRAGSAQRRSASAAPTPLPEAALDRKDAKRESKKYAFCWRPRRALWELSS